MEWRLIDTAPLETDIVLCGTTDDGETKVIAVGIYEAGHAPQPWRCNDGRDLPPLWIIPTHWMPLPPPPNTQST